MTRPKPPSAKTSRRAEAEAAGKAARPARPGPSPGVARATKARGARAALASVPADAGRGAGPKAAHPGKPATPGRTGRPATTGKATKAGKPDKPDKAGKAGGKRASRPRRAPGRPAVAAAQDHQARLLDAALQCFVAQGIAGTRLRDIAQRAGVTPALVHYYFGDKAQLLRSVVDARVVPVVRGLVGRLGDAGDDLPATVRAFVEGMAAVVQENPWWPQLWVREVLCEGGALRGLLIDQVAPGIARTMVARFAAAQARGELNPELDPRLLMTSLVGLTLFPAAGAPIWRSLLGAEELGMEAVARHALALLRDGAWARPHRAATGTRT